MERDKNYIDLSDVKLEHSEKVHISPETIEKVLNDLKMNQEEIVVISGSYRQWAWFCNLLISQVGIN